jgi:hypothetical protein
MRKVATILKTITPKQTKNQYSAVMYEFITQFQKENPELSNQIKPHIINFIASKDQNYPIEDYFTPLAQELTKCSCDQTSERVSDPLVNVPLASNEKIETENSCNISDTIDSRTTSLDSISRNTSFSFGEGRGEAQTTNTDKIETPFTDQAAEWKAFTNKLFPIVEEELIEKITEPTIPDTIVPFLAPEASAKEADPNRTNETSNENNNINEITAKQATADTIALQTPLSALTCPVRSEKIIDTPNPPLPAPHPSHSPVNPAPIIRIEKGRTITTTYS